jgi:hypothetical protein
MGRSRVNLLRGVCDLPVLVAGKQHEVAKTRGTHGSALAAQVEYSFLPKLNGQ